MGIEWPSELPVLSDDEITLRSWRASDADAVFLACQDSQIQRYTRVPVPYRHEHAESFVGALQQETLGARTGLGFAVTGRGAGEVLGAIGLVAVDIPARRGEAGYWTAPWGRGRGVSRRGLRLIAQWALADVRFDEIYVEIEATNAASLKAAERAGFQPDPMATHYAEHRGEHRRFVTMTRTARDIR